MTEQVKLGIVTYKKLLEVERKYEELEAAFNEIRNVDPELIQDLFKLFSRVSFNTSMLQDFDSKNLTTSHINEIIKQLDLKTLVGDTFQFQGKTFQVPMLKKYVKYTKKI